MWPSERGRTVQPGAQGLDFETWNPTNLLQPRIDPLKTPTLPERTLRWREIAIPRVDRSYSGEGLSNIWVQPG
jgi:hypothetical protein